MSVSAAQAEAFYREALATGAVWGLRDKGGFPAPEGTDGERAMPFWSKESRAARVVANVEAYGSFEVVRIPLEEWRGRWLPGLQRDGHLVGLNWSGSRATGYDSAPTQVEACLAARERGR